MTQRTIASMAATVAIAAVTTALGGGIAHADTGYDPTYRQDDGPVCSGTGPTIIDLPFTLQVSAYQNELRSQHDRVQITAAMLRPLVAPYSVDLSMRAVNVRTGATVTASVTTGIDKIGFLTPLYEKAFIDDAPYDGYIHPGLGVVDIAVVAQPHGRVPVGPVTCHVRTTVV